MNRNGWILIFLLNTIAAAIFICLLRHMAEGDRAIEKSIPIFTPDTTSDLRFGKAKKTSEADQSPTPGKP